MSLCQCVVAEVDAGTECGGEGCSIGMTGFNKGLGIIGAVALSLVFIRPPFCINLQNSPPSDQHKIIGCASPEWNSTAPCSPSPEPTPQRPGEPQTIQRRVRPQIPFPAGMRSESADTSFVGSVTGLDGIGSSSS